MKCTWTSDFVFSYLVFTHMPPTHLHPSRPLACAPCPGSQTTPLASVPTAWGGGPCGTGLRLPGNNYRARSSTLPAQNPTPRPAWAWRAGRGGPEPADGHSTTLGTAQHECEGSSWRQLADRDWHSVSSASLGRGLWCWEGCLRPPPGAGHWNHHQQNLRGLKAEPCPAHFFPPPAPQRGAPRKACILELGCLCHHEILSVL